MNCVTEEGGGEVVTCSQLNEGRHFADVALDVVLMKEQEANGSYGAEHQQETATAAQDPCHLLMNRY